eukprot:4822150-Amphidinium_carterae.1
MLQRDELTVPPDGEFGDAGLYAVACAGFYVFAWLEAVMFDELLDSDARFSTLDSQQWQELVRPILSQNKSQQQFGSSARTSSKVAPAEFCL